MDTGNLFSRLSAGEGDYPNPACGHAKDMFALLIYQHMRKFCVELSSGWIWLVSPGYQQAKHSQELRNRVVVQDPRQPILGPWLESRFNLMLHCHCDILCFFSFR